MLKKIINYIVIATFFLVPLIIWLNHFKPFVSMKDFIFILGSFLSFGLLLIYLVFTGKFVIKKRRIFGVVLIYLVINLLSFLLSDYADGKVLLILSSLIVMFFVVAYSFDEQYRDKLVYGLFIVSFISSIYGFFQFFGVDYGLFVNYFGSRTEYGMRIFTLFGNPNILGGFCVFMLPVIVGYWIKNRGDLKRQIIFAILFILNFLSLLMSQTRGSWIAFFASVILFIALYYRRYGFTFIKKYRISLTIICLTIIIASLFVGYFLLSSKDFTDPTSANIRLFYYSNTLDMISESPSSLLFGRGIGSFNVYYPLYRDNRVAYHTGEKNAEYRVEHPHNEHLEILNDVGIFGYLVFLWIIFEAVYRLLKKKDVVNLGFSVAILALLIDGIMSQNLRFITISSLLWVSLAFSQINEQKNATKIRLSMMKIIFSIIVLIICLIPVNSAFSVMRSDESLKLGISYYISQVPDKAIQNFEQVLKLDKNNKRALYYLASSYSIQGEEEKAISSYSRLLSIDPNFIQTNYRLGVIYLELQEYALAEDSMEKQIRVNNMYWQAYYALAYLHATDDKSKALQNLEEIEKISSILDVENASGIDQYAIPESDHIEILKLQAQLYADIGDLNNSLRILKILDNLTDDEAIDQNIAEIEKFFDI
ncbi:O-antigen ligase family protein [Candidatus Woesearchaeota archaeon]|nr:O-antigen ligase family protein [Candidatus Woesearchaeota archaeon]